jgi:alginate O-acetyltransferase complex protein AlgI
VRVGAVQALVVGRWLGEWAAPILATPAAHGRLALVAALDATALRFYLDFAGYSDVAIGLAAVFGVAILENFDRPFLRRNLALLWQHWHMTLTHWLRTYLFVPTSRFLLRRTPQLGDRVALACAQLVTMGVCGLWHGLSWNFLCWGLVQALGLAWVGLAARAVGRRLPAGVVAWWRASRAGAVCSTLVTVQFFALSLAFVVADVGGAVRLLARLVVG